MYAKTWLQHRGTPLPPHFLQGTYATCVKIQCQHKQTDRPWESSLPASLPAKEEPGCSLAAASLPIRTTACCCSLLVSMRLRLLLLLLIHIKTMMWQIKSPVHDELELETHVRAWVRERVTQKRASVISSHTVHWQIAHAVEFFVKPFFNKCWRVSSVLRSHEKDITS